VRSATAEADGQIRLSRGALGMLTGQDTRAIEVFVSALELYANSDGDGQRAGLAAMKAALGGMQQKCHVIARELIPFVLDWGDRERLWPLVSTPLPISAVQS
jgi:hypothetical protein